MNAKAAPLMSGDPGAMTADELLTGEWQTELATLAECEAPELLQDLPAMPVAEQLAALRWLRRRSAE